MIKFTIVKDRVVLDPNIVLLRDLKALYDYPDGDKYLKVIYYMHSTDVENPFRDLDARVVEENVLMVVFKKKTWEDLKMSDELVALYKKAEDVFLFYNTTSETRMLKALNRKMDEIAAMLDTTAPAIEEFTTDKGEIKFNSNLPIILNAFTKLETLMKSKTLLAESIVKAEGVSKVRGGGVSSFRDKGLLT
jgi:lipopolysaccharide biosynthesis glycosyltransferase